MSLNLGIIASSRSSAPSAALLLDTYPGAFCAYSLARKLNSSYTGNAFKVQRLSDLATLDIGFINNEIDLTALTTFIGSGTGRVYQIYDQSGNARHSSSMSNGPNIIDSGSLITMNSKPAMQMTATKNAITMPADSNISNVTLISISRRRASNTWGSIFSSNITGTSEWALFWTNNNNAVNVHCQISSAFNYRYTSNNYDTSTLAQINSLYSGTSINSYINNTLVTFSTSGSFGAIGRGFRTIGASARNAGANSEINFCESIIYNSDQSSNRTGINNNINSFYSIY